jgi:adenylate cyclase
LADGELLAERCGGTVEAAMVEVETWLARDRRLRRWVAEASRALHRFEFRPLDWIRVKGRQEPVALYELLGYGEGDSGRSELAELFDTALQAYRGQQWDVALEIFNTIRKDYPDDGPARLFAQRCRQYRAEPPGPDWDGVYVMQTK